MVHPLLSSGPPFERRCKLKHNFKTKYTQQFKYISFEEFFLYKHIKNIKQHNKEKYIPKKYNLLSVIM